MTDPAQAVQPKQPQPQLSTAARLKAALNPAPPPQEQAQPEAEAAQPVQHPEAEAQPVEPEAEATDYEGEPEAEGEAEEAEPQGHYTLKHQGETRKVTFDEMRELAQKGLDYTVKTQRLADERRQVQAKAEQQLNEVRGQYIRGLQTQAKLVEQAIATELQGVDFARLAREDPAQYVAVQARAQQLQQAYQGVQQALMQEQQQIMAQLDQRRQEAIRNAAETLESEGFTVEKYQKALGGATKYYGFSEQETHQFNTDARLIKLLADAAEYRSMQENRPALTKRVEGKPPVVKPGQGKPKQMKPSEIEELRRRTRESGGKDRDAIRRRLSLAMKG